jgi:hypothetical protein
MVSLPHKYCYPKIGGNDTLKSIHEYADIMRKRYFKANKKEKSQILNELPKILAGGTEPHCVLIRGRRKD